MKKLLIIKNSPTRESNNGSLSCYLLDKFLAKTKIEYPDYQIEMLDLDEIEYFQTCLTKDNFATYYDQTADFYIDQIKAADVVVISTPTINFNIPSLLKNYFDRILQARKTFMYKYDKGKGYSIGLLPDNKKAIIIHTQGSPIDWYPFNIIDDNLKGILEFINIKDIKVLSVDGVKTNQYLLYTRENFYEDNKLKIDELVDFIK